MDEEFDNIIVLNDEDGNEVNFEFLDLVELDGEEYVILLPAEESEEGPGYGGAILAAVGCGVYATVEEAAKKLVKVIDTVKPEPALVEKYEAKYQIFRNIYPQVKGLFQEL